MISCDLKMTNILLGFQAHSSTYPCTWCNIDLKNLENPGVLSNLGSIKGSYQTFLKLGNVLAKNKLSGNLIHMPIITGSDDTLILDIIHPIELYILFGVVNHLFQILKSN